jgi:hypothetical protein
MRSLSLPQRSLARTWIPRYPFTLTHTHEHTHTHTTHTYTHTTHTHTLSLSHTQEEKSRLEALLREKLHQKVLFSRPHASTLNLIFNCRRSILQMKSCNTYIHTYIHMHNGLCVFLRISLFISVSFNLSNSRIFACYAFIPFSLSSILVLFYRVSEEESLQVQYWVQQDEPLPLFLKRILKWEDTHTTHTTSLSLSLSLRQCVRMCVLCVCCEIPYLLKHVRHLCTQEILAFKPLWLYYSIFKVFTFLSTFNWTRRTDDTWDVQELWPNFRTLT